jgi:hypothetical protein
VTRRLALVLDANPATPDDQRRNVGKDHSRCIRISVLDKGHTPKGLGIVIVVGNGGRSLWERRQHLRQCLLGQLEGNVLEDQH